MVFRICDHRSISLSAAGFSVNLSGQQRRADESEGGAIGPSIAFQGLAQEGTGVVGLESQFLALRGGSGIHQIAPRVNGYLYRLDSYTHGP